ncbi:hypothetical protein BUALT_Bualt16G0011700 [Buddleja alternifolia]|uniref:Uncharacterized protein n=1 Tax=Buddleja alternifolia TaxID=168488 RepID=A0AAV6W9N2_9LAMI|nr:hypothetical protein BUALT_Bualt16G0011700 [Buddleja alternifolia]
MAVKSTLFLLTFVLLVTTMTSSVEDIDDVKTEGPRKDSLRAPMLEARIYAPKKGPTRDPAKVPAPAPIRAPIKIFYLLPSILPRIPGIVADFIGQIPN